MKRRLLSLMTLCLLGLPMLQAQCDISGVAITSMLIDPNSSSNNFDTDGDGNFEADDEFIEICNTTGAAVDISGWTLGDDDGDSFTFPGGTVLAAGDCALIVRDWDGVATIPPNVFDMNNGSGFLANGGDVAVLSDGASTCEVSYGSTSCGGANCDDWGSDTDGCPLLAGGADCSYSPAVLSALPVELVSFVARINNQFVELNWSTASEIENDYFSIEHSTDGRSYKEIEQVKGMGTSVLSQDYFTLHKTPANGLNYYRLKQMDFNGTFEYSTTEVVVVENKSQIRVFPSQAFETITIDLGEAVKENTMIDIIDVMGRVVLSQVLGAETSRSEINVAHLVKGHYFIKIDLDGQGVERFIKMN